jgi:hypothetical protein
VLVQIANPNKELRQTSSASFQFCEHQCTPNNETNNPGGGRQRGLDMATVLSYGLRQESIMCSHASF